MNNIKKIATITFHNSYNYGSVLQAFALQTYLKKIGYETKIIDFEYGDDYKQYKLFRTYLYLHQPKSFLADLYRLKKNIKRKKSFDEFTKKHLLLTSHHYVNEDDMSELNTQFDAFICGSDQIWNLECTKEIVPAYFLNFVANNKLKIAYAPSIASATFDGNKEELTNLIGRLDSVSVREKSTIDSVKEYTDKEINNTHIDRFIHLVGTHLKEQHSFQFYADKLCITPNYLNEIITSVMGVSAKQYIQNKVIDEAKRLLAYTDAPISDIAFELHFSTVSYFIRRFRQHTGETPLLYRKKYKP